MWEFQQIYNIGAVRDKDELVRCWGQKVNVKVTMRPDGQISTFEFLKVIHSNVRVTDLFGKGILFDYILKQCGTRELFVILKLLRRDNKYPRR